MRMVRLAITVDACFTCGESHLKDSHILSACDPDNLDISEVPITCHDLIEPNCKGVSWWAQMTFELIVEAETDEDAVEIVEDNASWYCEGWELDQFAVRVVDSFEIKK